MTKPDLYWRRKLKKVSVLPYGHPARQAVETRYSLWCMRQLTQPLRAAFTRFHEAMSATAEGWADLLRRFPLTGAEEGRAPES